MPTATTAPTTSPVILTPSEMAKHLRVSRATLAKWMRLGIVPYSKFSKRCVRFNLERVLEAIDGLGLNAELTGRRGPVQ